jgi:hypothetical protein
MAADRGFVDAAEKEGNCCFDLAGAAALACRKPLFALSRPCAEDRCRGARCAALEAPAACCYGCCAWAKLTTEYVVDDVTSSENFTESCWQVPHGCAVCAVCTERTCTCPCVTCGALGVLIRAWRLAVGRQAAAPSPARME